MVPVGGGRGGDVPGRGFRRGHQGGHVWPHVLGARSAAEAARGRFRRRWALAHAIGWAGDRRTPATSRIAPGRRRRTEGARIRLHRRAPRYWTRAGHAPQPVLLGNHAGAGYWRHVSVPYRLIWVLLASVLAVNVYRAATQSITVEPAFTHQHFVAPPLYDVMTSYYTHHHSLNSLLAKVSTGLFGVSELTLRIPSLAGGLIYLLAVLAILVYAFG